MFIRHQIGPYTQEVRVRIKDYDGRVFWVERVVPTMKAPATTPHGRNAYSGEPQDWGPDEHGYTDFDDYHLAIYGA